MLSRFGLREGPVKAGLSALFVILHSGNPHDPIRMPNTTPACSHNRRVSGTA